MAFPRVGDSPASAPLVTSGDRKEKNDEKHAQSLRMRTGDKREELDSLPQSKSPGKPGQAPDLKVKTSGKAARKEPKEPSSKAATSATPTTKKKKDKDSPSPDAAKTKARPRSAIFSRPREKEREEQSREPDTTAEASDSQQRTRRDGVMSKRNQPGTDTSAQPTGGQPATATATPATKPTPAMANYLHRLQKSLAACMYDGDSATLSVIMDTVDFARLPGGLDMVWSQVSNACHTRRPGDQQSVCVLTKYLMGKNPDVTRRDDLLSALINGKQEVAMMAFLDAIPASEMLDFYTQCWNRAANFGAPKTLTAAIFARLEAVKGFDESYLFRTLYAKMRDSKSHPALLQSQAESIPRSKYAPALQLLDHMAHFHGKKTVSVPAWTLGKPEELTPLLESLAAFIFSAGEQTAKDFLESGKRLGWLSTETLATLFANYCAKPATVPGKIPALVQQYLAPYPNWTPGKISPCTPAQCLRAGLAAGVAIEVVVKTLKNWDALARELPKWAPGGNQYGLLLEWLCASPGWSETPDGSERKLKIGKRYKKMGVLLGRLALTNTTADLARLLNRLQDRGMHPKLHSVAESVRNRLPGTDLDAFLLALMQQLAVEMKVIVSSESSLSMSILLAQVGAIGAFVSNWFALPALVAAAGTMTTAAQRETMINSTASADERG
ncbi:MAG: hypothetical protein JWP36_503 [Paucimonas sp.]|nr:hypothetical protein [Paucimonas sp.]